MMNASKLVYGIIIAMELPSVCFNNIVLFLDHTLVYLCIILESGGLLYTSLADMTRCSRG